MQKLNGINVNSEGMIIQGQNWDTPSYVKPYKDNIELNRIDFGNFNNLDKETLSCLLSILEKNLQNQDIVIISQQIARCLFVDEFIKKLLILMNKFCDTLFIVDSRHYSDCFPNAILKCNEFTAENMIGNDANEGVDFKSDNSIKTAKILSKKLYLILNLKNLTISLSYDFQIYYILEIHCIFEFLLYQVILLTS